MTAEPIARLIPHGEEGHIETRACIDCRPFLDDLEWLRREVLDLCALGLVRGAGVDERGEDTYTLTPAGHRWAERERARRTAA